MKEKINKQTGEITTVDLDPPVKILTGKRADGSTYFDLDFTGCPSRTEPHHAQETDINYLVTKFKPDELAAYLTARGSNKNLAFHDYTMEPDKQGAMNITYLLRQKFNNLPEDLQQHFGTPLNYLKFIDNPENIPALIKMGLLKATKQTTNQTKTKQKIKKQNTQQQQTTTSKEAQSSVGELANPSQP